MSGFEAALAGFAAMFALMLIRVPVGFAMGIVGVCGFGLYVGWRAGLNVLAQTPIRFAADESLGLIPMFILMGAIATQGGLGRDLFGAANAMMGHRRGGLAAATIWSSAAFAAICGSAIASAATMARVVLPEMKRFGYDGGVGCATIAVGGTLGILIPPSVVLALYGIITQTDIAQLFVAGIVPGAIAVAIHLLVIRWIAWRRPDAMPAAQRFSWKERRARLRDIWAVTVLFVFVVGGIYVGAFTPTESAAMGAGGALIISALRNRIGLRGTWTALAEAARTTGSLFVVVIGAVLFQQFLAVTRAPQDISAWVASFALPPYAIIAMILVIYFVLGALMDELAMILLTVPIFFPVVTGLGFDPIWFGVIVVVAVELGLIVPPVAMNLFVLHNIAPEVPLTSIFRSVTPFIVGDLVRLALLVAFPAIVLWLPRTMG